jgi:pimeloyl-ACP methyl ester carboxylesterase
MKLMWFHLMPCTELPEDFQEKNSSVWIDIDPSLFDPVRGHHMYNEVVAPSLPGFPGAAGHDERDTIFDWLLATRDVLRAADLEGATTIEAIAGAGHLAELDAPDAVAEHVLAFLEG